jgi:hypothetical protein
MCKVPILNIRFECMKLSLILFVLFVVNAFGNECKRIKSTSTQEEIAAVQDYTRTGYSKINGCLRGTKPCDKHVLDKIKNIDQILSRYPYLSEEVHYRLMSPEDVPLAMKIFTEGEIFEDKAYFSTNYQDLKIASGVRIVIHGKSGKDISCMSLETTYEKEALYPRGTKFIVKRKAILDGVLQVELQEI